MNAPSRILKEFTLLPEYRGQLGEVLEHYGLQKRLSNNRMASRQRLDKAVTEVLPREALEELERITRQQSEYALLIHGLPERAVPPFYVDDIAESLFRVMKCESPLIRSVIRKVKDINPKDIDGTGIHRDFMDRPVAGFAAPFNAEQAATEIIRLEHALETIPAETRRKASVVAEYQRRNSDGQLDVTYGSTTLQTLLDNLGRDSQSQGRYVVQIIGEPAEPGGVLGKAIASTSEQKILQPGDLLFLDEHVLFHRSHLGDKSLVPEKSYLTRELKRIATTHFKG